MSNIKKFRVIKFKSKPILITKNISKSFGSRIVLRKINITLNKSEMLGILGSNGAGKSTWMNVVLGIQKPDFGDVFIGDTRITDLAIHERAKLGISFLPQATSIFRGLTVSQNLLAIAQLLKKRAPNKKKLLKN